MEFVVRGWPDDGATVRLDYRVFSYAGKFAMTNTGKAVVRGQSPAPPADLDPLPPGLDGDAFETDVLAAVSFNEDRTEPGALWLRYVTVHESCRGRGLAPRLVAFLVDRARGHGYRRVRIAVNNPYAYEALYRAGFAYTGRETGIAELVLERPGPRDAVTYRAGFDVYRDRSLTDDVRAFLDAKRGASPPAVVAPPPSAETGPRGRSVSVAEDPCGHSGG